MTKDDLYYVRPLSWSGIWSKDGKLELGLAMFTHSCKKNCEDYIKKYENRNKLSRLISENPDLEVIPMVEYEVCCGDDYNRWAGSIGESKIREYFFDDSNEGELRYKDWYTPDGLKEIEERGIKWNKAIFLFIDLPEI